MDSEYISKKNPVIFSVAELNISISLQDQVKITENFSPFVTDENSNGIQIKLEKIKEFDLPENSEVFRNFTYSVHRDENGYYKIYHDPKDKNKPYAVSFFCSDNIEKIYYLEEKKNYMNDIQNIFAYISFEELMMRHGAMILHASFINTEYGGILFSGPSGIGKSTQADLWCRYKNAELINGDRTIIKKADDTWNAYGSPYAGSSECFVNKKAEIRGIFILEQSDICSVEQIKGAKAFAKLYSGMIVNMWNPEYVSRLALLIEHMMEKVPVYLFRCTKEAEAVEMLSEMLEREEHEK